jgi:hypothetical protein
MNLNFMVVAVVLFISYGQQSSLIAVQDSPSKPIASRRELSPTDERHATFSPDESKVVTWKSGYRPGFLSTLDGIQVWDVASNKILSVDGIPVFDPEGKWFALHKEGAVVVLDSNTGKQIDQLSNGGGKPPHPATELLDIS